MSQERDHLQSLQSRASHFRLKAGECLQLADFATQSQTRATLEKLARFYVRLAMRAQTIERHNYGKPEGPKKPE